MTQYPIPMGKEIIPEVEKNSKDSSKIKTLDIKQLQERVKNFAAHFKRPRAITLAILFMTIILISIALNFISGKNQEEVAAPPTFQSTLPSPDPSLEPSTENIAQRVKIHNENLGSLKNFSKDLPKPIVNLDISFKE